MTKQLIDIAVGVQKTDIFTCAADIAAVGVFEDNYSGHLIKELDKRLGGQIKFIEKLGDFDGKAASLCLLYTNGKLAAKRLLLVGLGKRSKLTAAVLHKCAAAAAGKAVEINAGSAVFCLHSDAAAKLAMEDIGQILTEGAMFGAFRYDEYITNPEKKRPARLKIILADSSPAVVKQLKQGAAAGIITGSAQNYARAFANRPANVITPAVLAAEAKRLSQISSRLRCTIFNQRQLQTKKMEGILAVGQGSNNPPRLIVLEYTPAGASGRLSSVALVGKAITFDSGGISLKPGEGMQDMKFDKSGGLAVLGAMRAIAALQPKVRVFGIIPAAENMPSGRSYRPGDIITTYSGKTVEIHSTDAEGRMILCDALAYAANTLGCPVIVDIATLTGACVVALGQKRAGLLGNDDELMEQLKAASAKTGERIWPLPCDDEYLEAMKSKIADLKNTGGKWGGACTAGAFLSQFVGKAKWAHIDMAGVGVWGGAEGETAGSIGFGVRLLTEFVRNYK
ncbi:MAG TPA: leucyl aminopeptidase [Anaerohalosphaeraceae bacterium]|nr:leucyl aminopeptidase [Phycisphaerae bacterium]HOK95006.1 leucyl aminopeptidase [Anaerohalosphaeraceae bacterium]HOL30414.1 leucyl aminopeptidase [Anaerohalosphaeraceae bacterium]HOM75686.1 leucyl aminopeptidase [Anaerohalosphaeraceae bacterium]HPC64186.1 leucyl aminopeptidase [Anaerohalosphaeraceae bacterium]